MANKYLFIYHIKDTHTHSGNKNSINLIMYPIANIILFKIKDEIKSPTQKKEPRISRRLDHLLARIS